jgi:hypothetical protein
VAVAEVGELVVGQVAPLPRPQPLVGDAREREPRQAHDLEPRRLAHPTDLLVSPLPEGDLDPRLAVLEAIELHVCGERLAVLELYAVAPALQILLVHLALHLHHVRLRDVLLRVQQPVGELAVVRQQQGAARVKIEPADGVEAHARVRHEVGHRRAALGVAERGDDEPRFVQHDVDGVLVHDAVAIELDLVVPGVSSRAELGDDGAVDAYPTAGDEILRGTARGDTGAGQDFLKALWGHGAPTVAQREALAYTRPRHAQGRQAVGP